VNRPYIMDRAVPCTPLYNGLFVGAIHESPPAGERIFALTGGFFSCVGRDSHPAPAAADRRNNRVDLFSELPGDFRVKFLEAFFGLELLPQRFFIGHTRRNRFFYIIFHIFGVERHQDIKG